MKTDKFYKLESKSIKKIDLKRTAKNMEDSSDSDFDSESDSDSSVKKEIQRYEPLEKPSRKRRIRQGIQIQEASH